jgi:O-methyltransferase domain/Dimerisation domain
MQTTQQEIETPQQIETQPPGALMTQMILSFMNSQAIYVAAKLGIADLVKNRPKTSAQLARETGVDARSLYRVLRALSSVGIFRETDPDCFGLTPLAETLLSDAHGSLRDSAIFMGEDFHMRVWGDIMHSVRTGQPAIEHVFGQPVFAYFGQNPREAAIFNNAMTSMSASVVDAIMAAYDFSGIERIVDIAGGHGLLISSILKAYPQMKGILFDVPSVIEQAGARLEAQGVAARCETATGDFFKAVPGGGDAYIMKHIIHDWDDKRALQILGNCQRVMRADDKLLLVEMVVAARNEPSPAKFIDLEMLLFTGGCERTEEEYRELLDRAGFRLTRITPTASPYSIIESVRR